MSEKRKLIQPHDNHDNKRYKSQSIRVGRIRYPGGKIPSYDGFETIVVMTASSKYGSLGPYMLMDEKKRNMENMWQFSKVYAEVPSHTAYKSKWDRTIIWQHGSETHYVDDQLTPEFWQWRDKGMQAMYPIRYPVGFQHRHKCLFAIPLDSTPGSEIKQLDYISARKQIYLPLYCRLVRQQDQFQELKNKLRAGANLLIVEVDGPHMESLDYYKRLYNVADDFIDNHTVLVNQTNMQILLNDDKHAFGHGYCLAMALLDVDNNSDWQINFTNS